MIWIFSFVTSFLALDSHETLFDLALVIFLMKMNSNIQIPFVLRLLQSLTEAIGDLGNPK